MARWEESVQAATAEILDPEGKRLGFGVLVDRRRMLTAAHAVRTPGGGVLGRVSVRFGTDLLTGCEPGVLEGWDVAVLRLPEAVALELPVPVAVAAPERRLPERVKLFGFPVADRFGKGMWRSFRAGGPVGEEWQLDWEGPAGSFKGQSGGPVVDVDTGELVGILTAGSQAGAFDRFLPVRSIVGVVKDLPVRWVFAGEQARSHAERRSRGRLGMDVRRGDLFTGRGAALAAIAGWLDSGHEVGRPLVVSGDPGSGKSAVLGRAALAAEASGGRAGLVFHAHSATYGKFQDAIRDAVDLDVGEDPLDALSDRVPDRGLCVMVDALDEAATSREAEQIAAALRSMAQIPGVAVVVATRRGTGGRLLARLRGPDSGSDTMVDLDSDKYADPEALAAFAFRLLAQEGVERPGPGNGAWREYTGRTGSSRPGWHGPSPNGPGRTFWSPLLPRYRCRKTNAQWTRRAPGSTPGVSRRGWGRLWRSPSTGSPIPPQLGAC